MGALLSAFRAKNKKEEQLRNFVLLVDAQNNRRLES